MKRILTAVVALPILLYTVWNDNPYLFAGLTTISIVIGLHEFYGLASKAGFPSFSVGGYAAALVVAAAFIRDEPSWIVASVAGLAILSLVVALSKPDEINSALPSVSATVFGVVYVALLGGFLIGVRMTSETPATPKLAAKLITTFLAMVMMTDTGAYYTGRSLGPHKLAPRISPGKTIEGSIGGFITAILAGLACKLVFFSEIPILHVLALGAVIGLVSQAGDLAESLLKRSAEVKDSGSIFPGHGGMLDRLDSILFSAPILFYYSRLFHASF